MSFQLSTLTRLIGCTLINPEQTYESYDKIKRLTIQFICPEEKKLYVVYESGFGANSDQFYTNIDVEHFLFEMIYDLAVYINDDTDEIKPLTAYLEELEQEDYE